jgi:hypothetical protein
MNDLVTVDRAALRRVLQALVGNPHEIRELQATREPASLFRDNPINILIEQYNARLTDEAQP